MTGKELRQLMDSVYAPPPNLVLALIDEAIANDAYDDAVCCKGMVLAENGDVEAICVGENHIETCPVLIAWQDRKAASEKRRGMR